jgi:hypothetical protein
MTCYICLSEKMPMITDMGCTCKGSIGVHRSCFREWVKTASDPFSCPVCKSDYTSAFLQKYKSITDMLFHGSSEEPEETESEMFLHGVPVMFDGEWIHFRNEEHYTIYQRSCKLLYKSEKSNIRNHVKSNKYSFKTKVKFHNAFSKKLVRK